MLPQRFHLFNAKMTANNTPNQQPTSVTRFERIAKDLLEMLKQIKISIEKKDTKLSPSMLREQTLGDYGFSIYNTAPANKQLQETSTSSSTCTKMADVLVTQRQRLSSRTTTQASRSTLPLSALATSWISVRLR
jgi:hypothetical protein